MESEVVLQFVSRKNADCKKVKIAHVNTLMNGGASVVATRLHSALLELEVDSILFTKYGVIGEIPKHFFLKDGRLRNTLRKSLANPSIYFLAKLIKRLQTHPNLVNQPKGLEVFSPITTTETDGRFDVLEDKDIIHLHWVNNFINEEFFFKKYKEKKFVWTLHDMNPITGGCHHADECRGFELNCDRCPQLAGTKDDRYASTIQKVKIKGLEFMRDNQLVIVSPSQWLMDLSKRSSITKRFPHVLIPNPSFKAKSFSESRASLRKNLGLPLDKKIVIFASDNLNSPRKGIHILFDAVRSISKKDDIMLLGIGHGTSSKQGLNIVYTGNISDVTLLAKYFYVADLFVTPSLAENSPLVVIEALTCGTPVVASSVGGIPELVNERNGLLFAAGHHSLLADAIMEALYRKVFDSELIKSQALQSHNPLKIAERYNEVYKTLLNS